MAEFGTPETWNMKVGDFIETELPKEKPQALLDLQEQNRKQRLLDSLQKIGPGLMDESLDFIRRENFDIGSDPRKDFTKFRTLDDELKTFGKKKGNRFLRYLGIYGDASFYQPELSISDKNTAKDLKGKKQLSDWWKTKSKSERSNIRQSFKSYETSVGNNPALRRKLYESLRTDKKFYNQFKKNAATKTITELAGEKGRTEYNKIQKEFDDIVFKKGKTGKVFSKQVTDDGKKILNVMKKDSSASLAKIIEKAKVPAERVSSALGALFNNTRDAAGKLRFNISNNIQKRLESFSNLNLGGVSSQLVKKGQATKQEVQKLITRPAAVLSKILPKGSVFEHTLPKNVTDKLLDNNLIDKKTYDALYRTGSRTSPFLNDFKAKFDIKQGQLLEKYLQDKDYKSYKKEIDEIRKTISDKTGGYKIGYVDFKDGKMNIIANAKPLGESFKKFGPETTQKYLALDNIKYTNNLLQNYNKNPNDEAFSSMLNKRTNIVPGEKVSQDIVDDYKFLEKSYNSAKPFLKSTANILDFAKKNLNNPVTRALFANPFGRAAGITTTALILPGALQADETVDKEVTPVLEEEGSLAGDIGAGVGLTTGAVLGSKATQADPLKGVRRFGKQGAKNLIKFLASPTVAAGFAGSELAEGNIKTAGASLLAPELAGTLASKGGQGILSRAGSILMNPFGRAARAFTPVGLATIGAGALKDVYDEYQRREALTDEERLAEDIERDRAADEMMIGAAEGGRIGFADGPDDPSKRKFMKLMGIMSLLPFGIGKGIKMATKAAPVVSEGVKLGFDKFMMLVNKIKELGTPTSKVTQKEREVGYTYTGKDGSEYELVEDLTTGDLRVTKDKPGFTMSGDEAFDTIEDRSTFVLKKGQADETTKCKTPPDEYDEVKEVPGPDGTFDDVDEVSDKAVKEVLDEID